MRKTKQLKHQNKSGKSLETKIEYTDRVWNKKNPMILSPHPLRFFVCTFCDFFLLVWLFVVSTNFEHRIPQEVSHIFLFSHASVLHETYTRNHLKGPLLTDNNFWAGSLSLPGFSWCFFSQDHFVLLYFGPLFPWFKLTFSTSYQEPF